MCLDPVHLVIVYLHARGEKAHGPGVAFLLKIMNNFNKVDAAKPRDRWGPPIDGTNKVPFTAEEHYMRSQIEFGTLAACQAARVEENLRPEEPFSTRFEFISALAALTALNWDEVKYKCHVRIASKGATLAKVLWNAAGPERAGWYFNSQRFRHMLSPRMLPLLPSGTSGNESLHHEVNNWFRNSDGKYLQTLEVQLSINVVGKLLSHNTAMYCPGLRVNT